ncbi:MAG: hypothetical protein F6J93_25300 [Oscillatoria sp. SIO1A7]|nr:hypothetical protein [Oscillatoria sp. SIO1A7]
MQADAGGCRQVQSEKPVGECAIAFLLLNLDLDFVTKIHSWDWQAIA